MKKNVHIGREKAKFRCKSESLFIYRQGINFNYYLLFFKLAFRHIQQLQLNTKFKKKTHIVPNKYSTKCVTLKINIALTKKV